MQQTRIPHAPRFKLRSIRVGVRVQPFVAVHASEALFAERVSARQGLSQSQRRLQPLRRGAAGRGENRYKTLARSLSRYVTAVGYGCRALAASMESSAAGSNQRPRAITPAMACVWRISARGLAESSSRSARLPTSIVPKSSLRR